MGAPWFKLYANDLLSDSKIRLLTDDQLGKLVKLWAFTCKDGSIPSDLAIASRLLGVASSQDLAPLLPFFRVLDDDPSKMVSDRMMREQVNYSEKCGKLKLNGKKGGEKKAANKLANAIAIALANSTESESESESEERKDIKPPSEVHDRKKSKPATKQAHKDSFEDILGSPGEVGLFWEIGSIWPRTSNQKPKEAAKHYAEARQQATHECILAHAKWIVNQSGGKITRLDLWLGEQDWKTEQDEWNRQLETA